VRSERRLSSSSQGEVEVKIGMENPLWRAGRVKWWGRGEGKGDHLFSH